MERQIREMEKEAWGLRNYVGTGSSVTFRDRPLVPKPPDVSWIEFQDGLGRPKPPKVYADEVE